MNLKQFRYSADNLGYLIYGKKTAVAVDGGDVEAILSFINTTGLELKYVVNTHTHPDHTTGNRDLVKKTGAEFLAIPDLIKKKIIELEGGKINIYHTPGHSEDSIVFHFDDFLVAGDTLFNGKVGRCFTGDLKGFLSSIKKLLELPDQTLIYAGHDYVEEYIDTAESIEPDNPHIAGYLEKYDPDHVVSTLAEELNVNPTLRFNDDKMIAILKKKGLPAETEYDRWKSVMSIV